MTLHLLKGCNIILVLINFLFSSYNWNCIDDDEEEVMIRKSSILSLFDKHNNASKHGGSKTLSTFYESKIRFCSIN
jgi:hypothetical protein